MKWHHECAPQWLEARKDVITATELIGLAPKWLKSIGAKKPKTDSVLELWAEKNSIQEPDTASWDWAARGHCLEPYAVHDWNNHVGGCKMYHWDDIVIKNGPIGFSPDALDIISPLVDFPNEDNYSLVFDDGMLYGNHFACPGPKKLLEIKSYAPKKHILKCLNKVDIDERWQIAVAMMVCDTIESGDLVFYNPSFLKCQMVSMTYTREQLSEEIEALKNTLDWYLDVTHRIEEEIGDGIGYESDYTEKQIWKESCMPDGFVI